MRVQHSKKAIAQHRSIRSGILEKKGSLKYPRLQPEKKNTSAREKQILHFDYSLIPGKLTLILYLNISVRARYAARKNNMVLLRDGPYPSKGVTVSRHEIMQTRQNLVLSEHPCFTRWILSVSGHEKKKNSVSMKSTKRY